MSTFRKPTTTNPQDFWHIKRARWDTFKEEAALGGSKKKAALVQLRRCDAAGRIMETDEGDKEQTFYGIPGWLTLSVFAGKDALKPCYWCTRERIWVPCKVFSTHDDIACAYCKLNGKGRCKANPPKQESDSYNEAVYGAVARARIDELQKEVASLNERVGGLGSQLSNLLGFFNSYQQWTT
ncbi:hypothetical protein M409DRAFT_22946 [Zasmidium cellare ATCC 36951]|uniref:Uncharacterized protein n=1 Tax=Zasmidium cellare ATCC 36951 TaxID=1080233 RepID=A0A6A6CI44_ZASCE|nr:uncharacterized protein M409DRAFT_22946 [Zasmidium cellare ATCC 36951]KAF2166894.1 hypothetical protein M409DRAFT_22946 [Zasmidium cellare ATCC 36951]